MFIILRFKKSEIMSNNKKSPKGTLNSDDDVSNNAHYSESGEISHEDNRDRKKSTDDWDAEKNRSGRHK